MRRLAATFFLALLPAAAQPQAWPSKPVRIIVGYAPGGGHDFVARTVGQRLSERLGQPFVVENRAGASGTIGTDFIAKGAPDGTAFLVASPAEVLVGPLAGQKVPYDSERDLAPVTLIGETPLAIASHPSVPAKTIRELIDHAKASPGRLSYGTPGSGSSMHFAGESLKAIAGVFIVHIPYRGAGPAVSDLLGGQLPLVIVGMPPVVGHHKTGKLRILAVTSEKRSLATPDIPAMAELPGFSGYNFTNWQGVYVAAKTPPAVVERLAAEIGSIVREPAIREKLLAAGVAPAGLGPADFTKFLARERDTYSRVAKARNIRADD